jgi:hypothetical protein
MSNITQLGATVLVKPASISYSAAPDRGPWTYLAYGSTIRILTGNVFISDNMDKVPIENLGESIPIDNYIILEVKIENGIPVSAELKSGNVPPTYRTFESEKSIKGQKTISAVILALVGGPGSYFSESSGFGIHKCAWSDLMIYANCDGLIFLPAPFSLPS